MSRTLVIYKDDAGYGADQVLDIFHYDYEVERYIQKEIGLDEMFADSNFRNSFGNDSLLLNAYKHVLKNKSKKYDEVIDNIIQAPDYGYTEQPISEIEINKGVVSFYSTYNQQGFMDYFYDDTIVECKDMKALFKHIRAKKDTSYIPEYYIDEDLQGWEYVGMESAKEFETYVMEKMAREMLAKSPSLKKEYENMKNRDTAFAKDQDAQLDWFFEHTPYWDKQLGLYPVARLMKK